MATVLSLSDAKLGSKIVVFAWNRDSSLAQTCTILTLIHISKFHLNRNATHTSQNSEKGHLLNHLCVGNLE